MEILFWLISIPLIVFGSLIIAFNFWIFIEGTVRGKHTSSVAPLLGGVFAAIGICLIPIEGTYKFAWIPLVVDCGGVLWFVFALLFYRD